MPCPVLECTTECADPAVLPPSSLSPAGQPPCPPAPLSHESVCSHAPSRRKGRGGLIVCVCVRVCVGVSVCACRGKGALHESSCFIPQSLGLLEYGKKIELCCMPSNLANIIIVDAHELTMTSSSNNKSTQTIIWVPCTWNVFVRNLPWQYTWVWGEHPVSRRERGTLAWHCCRCHAAVGHAMWRVCPLLLSSHRMQSTALELPSG